MGGERRGEGRRERRVCCYGTQIPTISSEFFIANSWLLKICYSGNGWKYLVPGFPYDLPDITF